MRAAQTMRNCHRQHEKTTSGVLAPLTNALRRTRPRLLSASSSDSDVHSTATRFTARRRAHQYGYTPRPTYIFREFRYKLELADGTARTERKLKMKLTPNNFALRPFVPSYSRAGAVTGTKLKAALTHRSSRPVFSFVCLPTSRGSFVVFVRW